jgi:hypothetical protein
MVLPDYLNFLSQNQSIPPETLAEQLVVLQEHLRNGRYLLVLDNMETILENERVGRFREGYEEYEQILQLFGGEGHQGCLLITSREAPALLSRLMQQSDRVHEMLLSGLDNQAGLNILEAEQIDVTAEGSAILTQKYSGNPLVLKLAAQSIQ